MSKSPTFRRRLLIGALILLIVIFALQRNQWAFIPNRLAESALQKQQFETAEGWLSFALRLSPKNPDIQLLQAAAARKQGKMSEVAEHLTRAQELGAAVADIEREQHLALAHDGQMREALPHLGDLLLESDGYEQDVLEAYAIGALKSQNHPLANRLIDVWMADFPDAAEPHFLKGVMHQDDASWNPAEAAFRKALELDPDHRRAPLHLGHCLLESKKPNEALPFFQAASNSPPTAEDARVGMAQCYRDLGQVDEARRILEQLLQHNPTNDEAALELARMDVDDGNYDEALERVRRLYDANPRDNDIRYVLATALRGAGKIDESKLHFEGIAKAREQLRKAAGIVQLANPDIEQRYQVGLINLTYGAPKMGIFWLRSVLDEAPDHVPSHKALEDYYTNRAETDPAFAALAEFHRKKRIEYETPLEAKIQGPSSSAK